MWKDVQHGRTEKMEAFIARAPAKVVAATRAPGNDSGSESGSDDDDDDDEDQDMMEVEHNVGNMAVGAADDAGAAAEPRPPKVDADGWETVTSPKKRGGKK